MNRSKITNPEERVPDERDNCALYNPLQTDLDRNGIGNEYDRFAMLLESDDLQIKFFREPVELTDPHRFPMDLECPRDVKCINPLLGNSHIEVRVSSETDLPIQITDERGFVVAQSQPGLDKVLRFYPDGDFFANSPQKGFLNMDIPAEHLLPLRSRQHFLNIFPSADVVPDQLYKIKVEVTSGTNE
jgi:hypothetical protein